MPHWTLAVDTSTYTQVIALTQDERVVTHARTLPPRHHGNLLLKAIDDTLKLHGITVHDLDLMVVGVGPGSFTGLRVGIACIKGLALATDCPIVGVSTLQALALMSAKSQPGAQITSAVDARKREVYTGTYAWSGASLEVITPERTLSPKALREHMVTTQGAVLAGFMTSKYPALCAQPDDPFVTLTEPLLAPDGVALAELGRAKFASTQLSEIDELEPNYIRPSDAEISLKKRLAAKAAAQA